MILNFHFHKPGKVLQDKDNLNNKKKGTEIEYRKKYKINGGIP